MNNVYVKNFIRRFLRVPEKVATRACMADLVWKKFFRVNAEVPWPVHFTSRIVACERITRGRASYPGDMPGCYIQAMNGIVIGDECEFGPGVGLISANHDPRNLDQHIRAEPIRIGDHCWFGMNAIVLPGVHLGPRTIVGAGSVVTRSFPDGNCVLAGNPAAVVRQLSDE